MPRHPAPSAVDARQLALPLPYGPRDADGRPVALVPLAAAFAPRPPAVAA